MPKYTYIGDEPSVFVFGLTFPKGVPVAVTDAHALKKLPNHPHFAEVVSGMEAIVEVPPGLVALPEMAPEIGAALTPEPQPENALMPKRGRRKKETV